MASILIIEDVPAVLFSMRIVLEGHGHTVTAASNGAAGLALLRDRGFELVITDIWMPGITGQEVIRQGRTIAPRSRFLAITGGDPNGADLRATLPDLHCQADDILWKPFEKADMLAAVDRVLAGTAKLPPKKA